MVDTETKMVHVILLSADGEDVGRVYIPSEQTVYVAQISAPMILTTDAPTNAARPRMTRTFVSSMAIDSSGYLIYREQPERR